MAGLLSIASAASKPPLETRLERPSTVTKTTSTIAAPIVPEENPLAPLSSSSNPRFVLTRKTMRTVPPTPG